MGIYLFSFRKAVDETEKFCYNRLARGYIPQKAAKERLRLMINGLSAVIFVPDDTAKTGLPHPLMLHPVLGAPLLAWLANSLFGSGVGRFFLVCRDRLLPQAMACLPQETEVMTAADSNAADLLHVFLSTAEEEEDDILVITGPVIRVAELARRSGEPVSAPAYRAGREMLMAALDEKFSFSRFLKDNCAILSDYDGFVAVDSAASAVSLANELRRNQIITLEKIGVEIYDADNCYIEPSVRLEPGVKLLPGAILKGNTVIRSGSLIGPWSLIENSEIGPGCVVNASQVYGSKVASDVHIGPYAHIRPDSELEKGAKIGNFVEVKNTHLGENTWVSHLSYLGDAQIGRDCNFGCGTVTVNFDRREKHKTLVGDGAFIGCNSALVAPVSVGSGAYVAAGSTVTSDVPENALAIARSRQTNKKDWASKHK